jgi:hypothetical protein
MDSSYIKALETRAHWLRWAKEREENGWDIDSNPFFFAEGSLTDIPENVRRMYKHSLECGDTFFMNKKFCSLVDHARMTIPDDVVFDTAWVQSIAGWVWLDEPFLIPPIFPTTNLPESIPQELAGVVESRISAISWFRTGKVKELYDGRRYAELVDHPELSDAVTFMCFLDYGWGKNPDMGYGAWSFFTIKHGDKLSERVQNFENRAIPAQYGRLDEFNAYQQNEETNKLHEMRWIYAAVYLMSQRLAMNVHHDTDRNTRRRAEREKTPVTPFLRVVTLRRLEEDRKKAIEAGEHHIDWQWSWVVSGHWRNQWFPATQEHKPVFVEAYIKGPHDKPLKPEGLKIFVARR